MAKTGKLSINSENMLPIIKKWLYSDHDIFVREQVANACDAITKLKKLEECAYSELGAENSDEGKQFRISFASDRKRNIRYRPSINSTLFMMLVVLLFLLAMFLFI